MTRGRLLILTTFAIVLALAARAEGALRFERCGGYGYSCARLAVPLDRSGAVSGRVSLLVKRARARTRPRRGAVFVLAGGPGQSATFAYGGDALGSLYPASRRYDVVVFDQRGTGQSGALRCRALERSNLLDAGRAGGACARGLGARRAFYTTRDSVEDIEEIRRGLGVDRIALFGTSYGTKVALAYALSYPANVDRLVLDSVVEADGPDPLYLDTISAVPRVMRALCRAACGRFTRDPVADLSSLVARLAVRPLRGKLVDSRGRRRRARLTSGDLFAVLLAGDYDPALRGAFPGSVRAALLGDATPLLRLRRRALAVGGRPPPARILSAALYAATTCEETRFPWARGEPPDPAQRRHAAAAAIASVPAASLFPFDPTTALDSDLLALCERWPAAAVAPALGPGPLPDVPVLLLQGEDDLRTPLENATRVAALFPRSTLVVSRATGHGALGSDLSGCAARAFARFFRDRAVPGCRRVRRAFRPRPPPPTTLGQVTPARGVRGVRGRAITALFLTLRDVGEDAGTELILDFRDPDLARGGGLRAGRYRLGGRSTLRLHGVAFVPGVRVSGRIRRFGGRRQRGRVRLRGRAAPRGLLSIRGNRVSGRLAGRRVRARLRPGSGAGRALAVAARLPGR